MKPIYRKLEPWTPKIRAAVAEVAHDLHPKDAEELRGLRENHDPEGIVQDVANVLRSGQLLDGFVAFEPQPEPHDPLPIAFAMAFRSHIPKVAELAFVGRRGHARAMAVVYRELANRAEEFGPKHGIRLAQVPILATHRAARRKALQTGGQEVFDYGEIGADDTGYVHCIWRWIGEGKLEGGVA